MRKKLMMLDGKATAIPDDMLGTKYISGELISKTAEFWKGKIHTLMNNASPTPNRVMTQNQQVGSGRPSPSMTP